MKPKKSGVYMWQEPIKIQQNSGSFRKLITSYIAIVSLVWGGGGLHPKTYGGGGGWLKGLNQKPQTVLSEILIPTTVVIKPS